MNRWLAMSIVLALMLPATATAQLHGTHERVERPREPGLRPGSLEALIAEALEHAHNAEAWQKHEAASFTMQLTLGGADPLAVQGLFATDGPAYMLSVADQPILGHDGDTAWQTPAAAELGDAEVHVRMLAMLPVLPYRLRDERTVFNSGPMVLVNERRLHAMNFQRVEDDDWTILLVDPHTNLLQIAAFFIRTSEADEPAFSPAFAMAAHEHTEVDGVPIPQRWDIWRWSRPRGLAGEEPIGTVAVQEVRFIDRDDSTFTRPDSAIETPAPGPPGVDDSGEEA